MIHKNEKSFQTARKAGDEYRAYLFYGAETFLVEKWGKALFGKGDDPFNSPRFDGRAPDLTALWDAAEALPLFAGEKRILLDDLDPGKLSADDLTTLSGLLEALPETTTLVATAKEPGFGSSAAGKKIIKLFDKFGACVELGSPTAADLVKFCRALAGELGCELPADVAKYLLEIYHNDMLFLETELRKICSYVGGGAITKADIDAVTTPKTEARVFDLQKLILAGNAGKALNLLRNLFTLREDPIAVLGTLSMSFCDLYRGRAARDAGKGPNDIAADFGYKSAWRAENAYRNAGKVSLGATRRAVVLLGTCDRQMKSSPVDNKILLEQAVVALIGLCGEGA